MLVGDSGHNTGKMEKPLVFSGFFKSLVLSLDQWPLISPGMHMVMDRHGQAEPKRDELAP